MVEDNGGYFSTDILDNTEEFIQLRLRKMLERKFNDLRRKHKEPQNSHKKEISTTTWKRPRE